jgi:hypothetical protein
VTFRGDLHELGPTLGQDMHYGGGIVGMEKELTPRHLVPARLACNHGESCAR